ncbi:MAG TPA: hypothetical protein VN033_07890 [Vulgatibacter sp.]|nr:hypothetical protein [Vulgatibacter sp.]
MRPPGGELRDWLPLLSDLAPFAPRAVEEELIRLAAHPRLLVPERRAVERLRDRVARLDPTPADPAACAFPVVTEGEAWLEGAVLHALASAEHRPGACPAEQAFPGERSLLDLLAASDGRAFVVPSPLLSTTRLCELVGDSCGAAFALALEAARRGTSVPRDVVVSAAIGPSADGLVLRAVAGCDRKRRVLERERPGCRFFYVPIPGDEVRGSDAITLVPLEEGASLRTLFDRLLAPRPPPLRAEALLRQVREAEDLFAAQRYDEARPRWERIAQALPAAGLAQSAQWNLTAITRLGAIELHAGRPEAAEAWFERAAAAAADAAGVSRLAVDQVRIYAAGALVDRMRPLEARRILEPRTRDWRRRLAADDEGADRREMLIACLGATRRLRLLLGDAEGAVEAQRELVGWAPAAETARAMADLGDALRRSGRPGQAREALARARETLDWIPLATYRLQTEAFLAYHEGRLCLDTGAAGPDPAYLRGLLGALPARSAARWRLEELGALLRLRDGDRDAAGRLIDAADRAEAGFSRWQACLGVLRGAAVSPADEDALHAAAGERFARLAACTAGYPALDAARLRFCERLTARRERREAAAELLRRSAY